MNIGHILTIVADRFAQDSATEAAKNVSKPAFPANFNRTQRVLAHMMREDTGASILDSGGAYGRSWQRNLSVPFWQKPCATVSFDTYDCTIGKNAGKVMLEPYVTIDLFHFLSQKLDYDRSLTRQFRKFRALPENRDAELIQSFPAWIAKKRGADPGREIYIENTYNCDNFLSQGIQFSVFKMDSEQYCILQIHGGCDCRGGYTAPQVFSMSHEWSITDYYRAVISPDCTEVQAIQEALKASMERQALEKEMRAEILFYGEDVYWEVGANDDHGEGCRSLDSYPVLKIEDRSGWVKGSVCILPDRSALCPETGAKLQAFSR